MDIKSVIKKYGETTYTVAEKMGISQPSVMQYINGNPTARKLEDIARAIGCSPAEFFADWSEPLRPEAQQPADKMGSAHEVSTEGKQSPDDLPFGKTSTVAEELQAVGAASPAAVPGALICPHCGKAFVIEIKNIV